MSDGDISIRDEGSLDRARKALERKAKDLPASFRRVHQNIGKLVKRTAVDYAPKSPTDKEVTASRERVGKSAVVHRPRTFSRPNPGGLMRSISWEADENKALVFIAKNSNAAKYAKKIHDEKGKTWFKRGIGTVAKGPQADAKFIERAVEHHRGNGDFVKIIHAEIDRLARPD